MKKVKQEFIKPTTKTTRINPCTQAKRQANKWWNSLHSKINYFDRAIDIGLPIDGNIL